jgi:hypothetical protein
VIVTAKIRGAVWSSKRLVLALLIMWTIGLLAGAIFPLGVLAAGAGIFVFCEFTAALGVWISLNARNSTRALFWTVSWMLAFNAAYLVLIPPPWRTSDLAFAGMMPYMEWASLVSYPDAFHLFAGDRFTVAVSSSSHGPETLAAYLVALFGYGSGAVILRGAAVESFDKAVDRPRRAPGAADMPRARKPRLIP